MPSNPTGSAYSEAELKALAEVLKGCDCWIIVDEIYGELHHKNQHVSIARYYPEGTIISNGADNRLEAVLGMGCWSRLERL